MTEARDLAERRRLLRIYLNDHLMGASAAVEVARRCLRANRGTSLAGPLERLLTEMEDDRAALRRVMAALGVPASRLKVLAGRGGEVVARLKLNGRLVTYSPLSRLLELDGLSAAAHVRSRVWRGLRRLAAPDTRLAGEDLDALVARADAHVELLEELRLDAVVHALPRPSAAGGPAG